MRRTRDQRKTMKAARALNRSQAYEQWSLFEAAGANFRREVKRKQLILLNDRLRFLKKYCKLEPYWYQLELAQLYDENQFLAVRWPRQTGKSSFIGALLFFDAMKNSDLTIAFMAPSWRQAKLNMRRVGGFCRAVNLEGLCVRKTSISFPNGSVLEAFPNNPETVRGQTFDRVWIDEANFISNDQDLYDAVLFAMGTIENPKVIVSSTPFSSDSLFWKMCNDKAFESFKRHHFSYKKALEPNGPLKSDIVEKIKVQFGQDKMRWRREMEAEWSEDDDVWLPQSLIVSRIGTVKTCGINLQPWDPEKGFRGDLFAGLDLAQVKDYCVFSVFERLNDKLFLRHLKIFSQPTKYANVLGYIKILQDRWGGFEKIRVDFTKEGPSIIIDMETAGIEHAEGVTFSLPRKSEMAGLLKQRMMDERVFYPHLTWEKPYRSDLCSELNVERYELRKDGLTALSHPSGSHDDVFWSIALAVYATVDMKEFDIDALRFG